MRIYVQHEGPNIDFRFCRAEVTGPDGRVLQCEKSWSTAVGDYGFCERHAQEAAREREEEKGK